MGIACQRVPRFVCRMTFLYISMAIFIRSLASQTDTLLLQKTVRHHFFPGCFIDGYVYIVTNIETRIDRGTLYYIGIYVRIRIYDSSDVASARSHFKRRLNIAYSRYCSRFGYSLQ